MLPVYELPACDLMEIVCFASLSAPDVIVLGKESLWRLNHTLLWAHHSPVVSSGSLYIFMPTRKAAHLCISCGLILLLGSVSNQDDGG